MTNGDAIDDVRVFPEGAFMQTYTFDRMVGVTTETDANNRSVFYTYDDAGRLKVVKDAEGKVLKVNEYHYGQ